MDANTFWFMAKDSTMLGRAVRKNKASGSLTLSGNYAFGSSGDSNANIGGVPHGRGIHARRWDDHGWCV